MPKQGEPMVIATRHGSRRLQDQYLRDQLDSGEHVHWVDQDGEWCLIEEECAYRGKRADHA